MKFAKTLTAAVLAAGLAFSAQAADKMKVAMVKSRPWATASLTLLTKVLMKPPRNWAAWKSSSPDRPRPPLKARSN